jgi:hypothetical protein
MKFTRDTFLTLVFFVIIFVTGFGMGGKLTRDIVLKQIKDNASSPAVPSACTPLDLDASLTMQGAAGSIYGTFKIENKSNRTCTVSGANFIKINYDQNTVKNLTITNQGLAGAKTFTLDPNNSVYATIKMQNGPQCQTPIVQVPVTFTYQIEPSTTVIFHEQNGNNKFSVTACQAEDELTAISVTNMSDLPVTE